MKNRILRQAMVLLLTVAMTAAGPEQAVFAAESGVSGSMNAVESNEAYGAEAQSSKADATKVVTPEDGEEAELAVEDTLPDLENGESGEVGIHETTIQYHDGVEEGLLTATNSSTVVRDHIMNYVNSLGGYFTSPYRVNGTAKAYQCCAYVNQVWRNVFGEDLYSIKASLKNQYSNDGETMYQFMNRVGLKTGDIIYTRYAKSSTSNGKTTWSMGQHYVVILDYDETYVWYTDGYENKSGQFVIDAKNRKVKYSDSKYFKYAGGSYGDISGAWYDGAGKSGCRFRYYSIPSAKWTALSNQAVQDPDPLPAKPVVTSASTSVDYGAGTYTVTANITAAGGIDRVQFPSWTVSGGQDDIITSWDTSSAASGSVTSLGGNYYRAVYTVKMSDHGNETGQYITHVYAYDKRGQSSEGYPCATVDLYLKADSTVYVGSKTVSQGYFYARADISAPSGLKKITTQCWTAADSTKKSYTFEKIENLIKSGITYKYLEKISISDFGNYYGKYYVNFVYEDSFGYTTTSDTLTVDMSKPTSGTWGSSNPVNWTLENTDDGGMRCTITGSGDIESAYNNSISEYPWYAHVSDITEVVIGEGITNIPQYAFHGGKKIHSLQMPSTLKQIDTKAFCDCAALTGTLEFPASVGTNTSGYTIGNYAFSGTGITDVIFKSESARFMGYACNEISQNCSQTAYNAAKQVGTVDANGNIHVSTDCGVHTKTYYSMSSGYVVLDMDNGYVFPVGITIHYPAQYATTWQSNIAKYSSNSYAWNNFTFVETSSAPESLTLSRSVAELSKGDTLQLTAEILPSWATNQEITWESDEESIASVDSTGLVTAKGVGSTIIRAVSNADDSISAICVVTVSPSAEKIELSRTSLSLLAGESATITGKVYPTSVNVGNLVWSSSDETVAMVSGGKVTALNVSSMSEVTITAATADGLVTASCSVTVKPSEIKTVDSANLSQVPDSVWIAGFQDDLCYTGKSVTQNIRVYDGRKLLAEGTDYSVSYKNNKKIADDESAKAPTMTVKMKGSYSGSIAETFSIVSADDYAGEAPISIAAAAVNTENWKPTVVYTAGNDPAKGAVQDESKSLLLLSVNGTIKELDSDDYTVTYSKNLKAGTATATFSGIGSYTGSFKAKFKVLSLNLGGISSGLTVSVPTSVPYAVKGASVEPVITLNGVRLREGVDYTVKCKNVKAIATRVSAKPPTVIISGKGLFGGSISRTFDIVQQDISKLTVEASDVTYGKTYSGSVKVRDLNGSYLKAGTDYLKSFTYDIGKDAGEDPTVGSVVYVTVTGCGNYQGTVTGSFRIVDGTKSIAKAKVMVADQVYTGSPVQLSESAIRIYTAGNASPLSADCYEIVGYSKNDKIGKAKVTIQGTGDYCGTKTVSFKITAKSVAPVLEK